MSNSTDIKTELSDSELQALIHLLDDTDEEIYSHIEHKLVSYGKVAITALESAWGSTFDLLMQERIENIIHKIQFDEVKAGLRVWKQSEDHNIIEASILVARYQYPDLDVTKLNEMITKIKKDAWIEMNDNLTALEKIKVLNHIFFEVYNFSGNTTNFHAPQNSFINNVVESRKGNPLSLSILYAEIARSVEIPLYGVNLPEHFVLAYHDDTHSASQAIDDARNRVLFYVNPFSKGAIFSKKDIDSFLGQLKVDPDKSFYLPCSNVATVRRLVRNLMNSYDKLGYPDKIHELQELMDVIED